MTYRIILFASSEWCQDKEQHSTIFPIAEKNENMRKEKARDEREKKRERERGRWWQKERAPIASLHSLCLSLSLSLSIFSNSSYPIYLQSLPFTRLFSRSYSHAVLLLFFCTRGNTEHLLRKVRRRSGWRGCSSTMQSMHSETKRQ